jgi:CRP-like cAMP-binding protein
MTDRLPGADLAQVPLLQGLGVPALDRLAGVAVTRRLADGESLFEQGADARDLYLIVRGSLALRVEETGGRWTTVQGVNAPDILGWSALRESPRWLTTARALGPVEVVAIPLATILDIVEAGGPDARRLVQRLFGAGAAHLDAVRAQLQQPAADPVITGG